MRKKVEQGKGDYILNPDDKSGRLMKRVGEGKGNYIIYSEGVDNDLDGKFNEDGIGGLDLHRNYPENWRPEPGLDLTGRGWTQLGAGAYPLSENETRSVVVFLLQHPNVSIGQTMDTTVPMHLRPPSTSRSEESMFEEDLKLYKYFDEQGKRLPDTQMQGMSTGNIPILDLNSEKKLGKRGEGGLFSAILLILAIFITALSGMEMSSGARDGSRIMTAMGRRPTLKC